jgi:glutathione peroxidase
VNQYAIEFPMFGKSSVRGAQANPLFTELARASGAEPRWNFHKYLVDRGGRQVMSFDTKVAPGDPKLVAAIERLLEAR